MPVRGKRQLRCTFLFFSIKLEPSLIFDRVCIALIFFSINEKTSVELCPLIQLRKMFFRIALASLFLLCNPTLITGQDRNAARECLHWTPTIFLSGCASNPCQNFATCLSINSDTDYFCICPSFLPLTGKNCDVLIPSTSPPPLPCASNPCSNGGTCTDVNATTYLCSCNPVFYGNRCESETRDEFSHSISFPVRCRYQSMLYSTSSLSERWNVCSRAERCLFLLLSCTIHWFFLWTADL